jgi:hypothetical protein
MLEVNRSISPVLQHWCDNTINKDHFNKISALSLTLKRKFEGLQESQDECDIV